MQEIAFEIDAQRVGRASGYLGGLTVERYTFTGATIPTGTRLAILTRAGVTIAAAEIADGNAAEVDTNTQEVADLLRYQPLGACESVYIALGDADNILALIPAVMRKNWLDDEATHPPVPANRYPTKTELDAWLARFDERATAAETAKADAQAAAAQAASRAEFARAAKTAAESAATAAQTAQGKADAAATAACNSATEASKSASAASASAIEAKAAAASSAASATAAADSAKDAGNSAVHAEDCERAAEAAQGKAEVAQRAAQAAATAAGDSARVAGGSERAAASSATAAANSASSASSSATRAEENAQKSAADREDVGAYVSLLISGAEDTTLRAERVKWANMRLCLASGLGNPYKDMPPTSPFPAFPDGVLLEEVEARLLSANLFYLSPASALHDACGNGLSQTTNRLETIAYGNV